MSKILVIGSSNMDYTIYCSSFPKDGETIYGKKRIVQPGGKGANQAAAAAKSELVPVTFICSIGSDSDGENIQKLMKELGINALFKVNSDTETGNATIDINEDGENKIIIIAGANALLNIEDISESVIAEHDIIVLQNEIKAETNAHILKTAHNLSKTVIYNPAPVRDIDDELLQYVDYFIVNVPELLSYSKSEDISKGVETLQKLGIKNIIVTLGSKGSLFINKDEEIKIEPYKVEAVDTVAAGDTYVGYFAACLAKGYTVKEALNYASKASSITVTRQGSIISIPFGNEVF